MGVVQTLEKLPADRFPTTLEFSKALADPGFTHGEEPATAMAAGRGRWNPLSMVLGASTLAFALGFGWLLLRPQLPQSVAQFESPFREGQGPIFFGANGFDLSPDGAILVYRGPVEGAANRRVNRLWVRRWDDPDASSIRGTESASSPAVSPDGRQLAFQQGGQIRVLSFSGGPIRTLAAGNSPRWGPDGHIYFLASGQGSMRVPVTGGPPEPVTHVAEGEATHFVSDFLPGGEGALMHVIFSGGEWEIRALRFDTGEMTTLTPGRWPRYAASGHLTFRANNGSLMAAPFDPRAMEITGPVVPMIEDVTHFALSETGSLIYSTGQVGGDQNTELVWVTRIGATEPVDPGLQFDAGFGRPGSFGWKLSPDGGRVAVTRIVAGNTDIWIKQLPNGPFERLTLDAELEMSPFWSPDGQFVAYGRGAGPNSLSIWRSRSDGAGAPELWLRDAGGLQGRWSPDGAWMIFRTAAGTGLSGVDIVGFRPDQDSVATPLLATDFIEQGQALSPDGHWLAYSSNESGQTEVYVRPFPEVESGRAQVSTNGGSNPLWAHSGAELFYVNADLTMIAAQIETDSEFRVLAREVLFTLGPGYVTGDGGDDFYDVAPDDQRFLMGRLTGTVGSGGDAKYVLVQNFFEELKARVPN